MERPALQRILTDIKQKLIDVVVVYKVDRLTRSLADFAKMVEVFDTHGVSFVAVTQQFNAGGEDAARRFLEFFASNIRNRNTRLAYSHAVGLFLAWCEEYGVRSLSEVQPLHVAAWIEAQTLTASAPTVKLGLAAIRHLFDWLVIGQIVPVNPASSGARAPSYRAQRKNAGTGAARGTRANR